MRTLFITMLLGGMLVACNNKQTTNNDMKQEKRKVKSCQPSPSLVLSEPSRSSVADSMP